MIFVGNDIVEVSRIKQFIEDYDQKFLDKVFTVDEQAFCNKRTNRFIHFSGRFAAKEAVKKIFLQTKSQPIPLKLIEIKRNSDCPPQIFLEDKLQTNMSISISHTENYATAVAILEKK